MTMRYEVGDWASELLAEEAGLSTTTAARLRGVRSWAAWSTGDPASAVELFDAAVADGTLEAHVLLRRHARLPPARRPASCRRSGGGASVRSPARRRPGPSLRRRWLSRTTWPPPATPTPPCTGRTRRWRSRPRPEALPPSRTHSTSGASRSSATPSSASPTPDGHSNWRCRSARPSSPTARSANSPRRRPMATTSPRPCATPGRRSSRPRARTTSAASTSASSPPPSSWPASVTPRWRRGSCSAAVATASASAAAWSEPSRRSGAGTTATSTIPPRSTCSTPRRSPSTPSTATCRTWLRPSSRIRQRTSERIRCSGPCPRPVDGPAGGLDQPRPVEQG